MAPCDILKKYGIALTGSVATGKSTVAARLRSKGYIVFDADEFARIIVKPGSTVLDAISTQFGQGVIDKNGELDRAILRDLVLKDPAAKTTLEDITHPAIHDMLLSEIKAAGLVDHPKYFFYEAALIHEKKRAGLFRETWCTVCSPALQLERLTTRPTPTISLKDASKLIAAQMTAYEKARLSTRVIDTNGSLEHVERQLIELIKSLI